MDLFLEELKAHHKVTIYALPLLALNMQMFEGFINCYIDHRGSMLCVEVAGEASMSIDVLGHRSLRRIKGHEQSVHFWFAIPDCWQRDTQLIIRGQYSQMCEKAKDMIRTYSGLPYRITDPDGYNVFTDYRLLALDRAPSLREKWEEIVGEDIPESAELIQPPGEEEFLEFIQ